MIICQAGLGSRDKRKANRALKGSFSQEMLASEGLDEIPVGWAVQKDADG